MSIQPKNQKLIIFADPAFPVDGTFPTEQALNTWEAVKEISVVNADELAEALKATAGEGCFINLHAPYFPKSAWTEIAAYLHQGGSLISVGAHHLNARFDMRMEHGSSSPSRPRIIRNSTFMRR